MRLSGKALNKRTSQKIEISANATPESLLKRAFIFIEDKNWDSAYAYCEATLDADPEMAEAYLGKMMAEYEVSEKAELVNCAEPFDGNDNYKKILRFGSAELIAELNGYINQINERNERIRLEAERKAEEERIEAERKAEEERIEAERKAEAARLELKRKEEEKRIKTERTVKKLKKVAVVVLPIIAVVAIAAVVFTTVIQPMMKYNSAVKLMENGQYEEAYNTFREIADYKDSAEKADSFYIKVADAGNYVFFGDYEQDNDVSNGKEDVEWLVLAKEDNKLLLISRYALDCQPYDTSGADVTWETCTLRSWLNDTFINDAFSSEEQAMIATTTAYADKNPYSNIDPGKDTQDKIFLLSFAEAKEYFSHNQTKQCKATAYAEAQGAIVKEKCQWWLRTPGRDIGTAACVCSTGEVSLYGVYTSFDGNAVRPAMWVDIS